MKIEKTPSRGILFTTKTEATQVIYFDTEQERDVIFNYWNKAIEELEERKAVFRPVYEESNGDTRILKLRYTTPEQVIRVEKARKEYFPHTRMKLIMIYNEQEKTFQNVNN